MRFPVLAVLLAVCITAEEQRPSSAGVDPERCSDIEITWHIPKPVEPPAPEVLRLHVLTGFHIQESAEKAGTQREASDILMVRLCPDGLAAGEPVGLASRPGQESCATPTPDRSLAAEALALHLGILTQISQNL